MKSICSLLCAPFLMPPFPGRLQASWSQMIFRLFSMALKSESEVIRAAFLWCAKAAAKQSA